MLLFCAICLRGRRSSRAIGGLLFGQLFPFFWTVAGLAGEHSGECGAVAESAQQSRVSNGIAGQKVPPGLCQTELQNVILNGQPHSVFENTGKMAAVEAQFRRHLGDGKLVHIAGVDLVYDLLHIVRCILSWCAQLAVNQKQVAGQPGSQVAFRFSEIIELCRHIFGQGEHGGEGEKIFRACSGETDPGIGPGGFAVQRGFCAHRDDKEVSLFNRKAAAVKQKLTATEAGTVQKGADLIAYIGGSVGRQFCFPDGDGV